MAWDDNKREAVKQEYLAELDKLDTDEQKAQQSMEIVKEIAERHGESPNGTRTILSKLGVYVKTTTKAATAAGSAGGAKRTNKAEAIQALTNQIAAIDPDLVDPEILEKLTGKAALYFTGVLTAVIPEEL